MFLQNLTSSVYNLFYIKKYLKYLIIILLWLMYYFGVFTHLLELDYQAHFIYPLETNISKCILNLQLGKSDQPPCIKINSIEYDLLLSNNKCNMNLDLLILVKSSLQYFNRRKIIRQTWGLENKFSEMPTRTVFVLGKSYNIDLQKQLQEEHEKYGDIIQYDFIDEYYNNTIKTLSAIKWASTHCNNSRFYFFSDDDMYVSIKNLLSYLQNPTKYPEFLSKEVERKHLKHNLSSDNVLFTGYVFNTSPLRHQTSKWYVSLSEYPYDMWPPYVTGGAYVLSHAALIKFHYGSFYTQLFRFDDIYLGLLAKKLNIKPLNCDHIYFYKKHYTVNDYNYVIASHGYDNSEELLHTWLEQKSYARNIQKCIQLIIHPWPIRTYSTKLAEDDLKVTENCIKRLQEICDKDEFLRLSVESGGCSGFQYKFELDTTIDKDDCIFEKQGVKIVVDTTSLDCVRGSTVDYEQQLIRAAFKLMGNPKAQDGCSCGASFSIKID